MLLKDPSTIERQEGPSGDLYAMPKTSGKKKKKHENKRREDEEVQQPTQEEIAALYSVPDRKGQKAKSEGVSLSWAYIS